jgi:hypothetical protein
MLFQQSPLDGFDGAAQIHGTQLQQVPSIPDVGLLVTHHDGPNPGGITRNSCPHFASRRLLRRKRRLNSHASARQAFIERSRFPVRMGQSPFDDLPCLDIEHRNLLIACVQITSDNEPCSAPFFCGLGRLASPILRSCLEPTPL